jgi:hypothetical protein
MNKFLLKTLLNGIVVIPLLMWFTEANFWSATFAAVALSTIAYFIGDQWILRATNNIVATLADAVLAFTFFWMVAYYLNWTLAFSELVTIVLLLGVVEYIFHGMLGRYDKAKG